MGAGIELFNMFARLRVDASEFSAKLSSASTKFKAFTGNVQTEMKKVDTVVSTGLKVVGGAVVTVATLIGKAGMTFNTTMENYQTNFEVMLGSAEKAAAKVAELQKMAAETPFGMDELADATQTLLNFQVPAEKSRSVLQMLGDVALGDKEKLKGLALVFGQVSSAGKLQGQDLLQMINQGFNPLNYIAKRTGETMEQLRDRMSKGKVTIDEVTQAFEDATSEGGMFYQGMEKASKTTSGLWSTFMDDFNAFSGEVLQPISDALKNHIIPALQEALGVIRTTFREVTGITEKLTGTSSAAGEGAANWLTSLTAAWSDGKKESDELMNQFISDFKGNSDEIRKLLDERKKSMEESGMDTSELDASYKKLDEYDAEIETLLKKRQNKTLTEEDQARLAEIVAAKQELEASLGSGGGLGEAANAAKEFGDSFGKNVANGIKKAGDMVAWAIKNWDQLKAALKAGAIALGTFKVAMAAVNLVTGKSTIGLIVTGIMAAVAAFSYFYDTNEDFRNGVIAVWGAIKGAVTDTVDWIVKAWNEPRETLFGWIDWVAEKWNALTGWFKGLDWKFPSIDIPGALRSAIETVSGWWDKAQTWFKDLDWSLPEMTMPGWVESVLGGISDWWDKVQTWFTGLDWSLPEIAMPEWVESVLGVVSGWWEDVKTWFIGLAWALPNIILPGWAETVLPVILDWWDKAQTWFTGLDWSLPEIAVPEWVTSIGESVGGLWEKAQTWFKDLEWSLPEITVPEWVTTVGDAIDGFVKKITGAFEGIQEAISKVWPPKITMPHFSVTGSMNPIDWFTQGTPSVSVKWYAAGAIFKRPTIFDTPAGMKGVGEAGAEAVLPLNRLWTEMSSRLDQAFARNGAAEAIDYGRIEKSGKRPVFLALDGRVIANTLADKNSYAISSREQDLIFGMGG